MDFLSARPLSSQQHIDLAQFSSSRTSPDKSDSILPTSGLGVDPLGTEFLHFGNDFAHQGEQSLAPPSTQ